MELKFVEKKNSDGEMFFDVIDPVSGEEVGYFFTVKNHIAISVHEDYRQRGIATAILKDLTKKIEMPVLEIYHNNINSKKLALTCGYRLVESDSQFGIYRHFGDGDAYKSR